MKQNLLKLLVALVAMFGCLGNTQAQEYTVTLNKDSNKEFTGDNNGGVKFSITNLGNWENAGGIIGDRHYAGYEVASETNSVISWQVPSNLRIKLSKVEVKATAASGTTRKRNIDLYTSKSTVANCISVTCSGGFNEAKTLTLSDYNKYFDGIGNDGTITIQHGDQKMYIYSIEIKYELEVEANLTISGIAHWGTFVAPFDVTLPGGVTAYKVTADNDQTVTAQSIGSKVPANTAVLVTNEEGGKVDETYYGVATGTENANSGDFLVGVYDNGGKTISNSDGYLLQYDSEAQRVEFRKGNNKTVGKNRAYLKASTTDGPAKLRLVFANEETSIYSTENATHITAIYSLSGAKLDKMQKGVNIVKKNDGSVEKVIVK